MLLGELLSRFDDEATAEEAALAIGDLVLLSALHADAAAQGLGIGELMMMAMRRYSAAAGDEEWLSLMAALARSDDPARVALERMLRWSLTRDAADASIHPDGRVVHAPHA
jgi:hypothetical protein